MKCDVPSLKALLLRASHSVYLHDRLTGLTELYRMWHSALDCATSAVYKVQHTTPELGNAAEQIPTHERDNFGSSYKNHANGNDAYKSNLHLPAQTGLCFFESQHVVSEDY